MHTTHSFVSKLLSAGLVATIYVYIKFCGIFFLSYKAFDGLMWTLASVIFAYLIVASTLDRSTLPPGRMVRHKAIALGILVVILLFFPTFFPGFSW